MFGSFAPNYGQIDRGINWHRNRAREIFNIIPILPRPVGTLSVLEIISYKTNE